MSDNSIKIHIVANIFILKNLDIFLIRVKEEMDKLAFNTQVKHRRFGLLGVVIDAEGTLNLISEVDNFYLFLKRRLEKIFTRTKLVIDLKYQEKQG